MRYPPHVRLVEVGPRDGLQNEQAALPVQDKVSFIEALAEAGLRCIECGSFVSPRRVPQMAGSEAVFHALRRRPGVSYTALMPNLKGLEKAAACKVEEIAVFVSASEAFSRANINCSIAESLWRAGEVVEAAGARNMRVRGYVSCVLGCPFAGEVSASAVARVANALAEMGCYEISLGDTIGVGTPVKTQKMLDTVAEVIPVGRLAVHYHDTWGQALANVLASLEVGISVVDSSAAGLGGCPYARGATGNVATEDVIYMLNGMGIETGVDLEKVAAAGRQISGRLGRKPVSKVAQAILAASKPHALYK